MQGTFAYIHCERKMTRAFASHQPSQKRQVRISVPPGHPPSLCRPASKFPEREITGSLGVEKNHWAQEPTGCTEVHIQGAACGTQLWILFQIQIKGKDTKPAQALSI